MAYSFHMANNEFPVHAHIEKCSQDWDGRYTSGYTMVQTFEEQGSDTGDVAFHERIMGSIVNTYSLMGEGKLTVSRLGDGDVRATWSEPTEEGFTETEVTFCTDDCDLGDSPWQRDHTAEAAGY